ncbi:MAG: hypothetical protein ABSG56_27600 [Bryobacteraceae bacterium]|jgi:hypothetical protein
MFKRHQERNEEPELEERRVEALSAIGGERASVEAMAQRPRSGDDVLDVALLQTVLKRLDQIEASAKQATRISDLDDLTEDAEVQGQFSAYLCPRDEIDGEGELVIDTIEGWGIPKAAIKRLRDLFGKKLEKADTNPAAARSALHSLFVERDAWSDYVDDYEDTMRPWARGLFCAAVSLPLLATLAFHFAAQFSPLLILGLLLAGAAGSSVSVMAKMPALDVSLAGELDAYGRRVLSRIGIGVIASLIGSASLAWLPVSVQNQTFADALNSCATTSATSIRILVILGLPMLLGFSERSLTSFEQRVFGNQSKLQKG